MTINKKISIYNILKIIFYSLIVFFGSCYSSKNLVRIIDIRNKDLEYRDIYGNYIKIDSGNKKIVKDTEKKKKILQENKLEKHNLLKLFTNPLGIPEAITPVENFDLELYLGTWYEIARLNHHFEKNLKRVTATYTKNGEIIDILNKGYKPNGKLKSLKGKAKFVNEDKKHIGHLKITYFTPFYGSYVVFYLEQQYPNSAKSRYEYALVCGSSYEFCWILARQPKIDIQTINRLVGILKEHGFNVQNLIFPWEETINTN